MRDWMVVLPPLPPPFPPQEPELFQLGPVFFSKYSLCMIREGRHLSKTEVPFPDFFLCAFTRELSIASAGCMLDQQWAGRPQLHAASHDVMHALALFVNLGRPL